MNDLKLRKVKSNLMLAFLSVVFIISILPILHLIGSISINGIRVISSNFPRIFTETRPIPGSTDVGGIGPYIFGSLLLTGIASLIAVALALSAAVFTSESISRGERRLGRATKLFSNMLIEFPTIIIGLTVYEIVVATGKLTGANIPGFSALSGIIALVLVAVPYIFSQIEDALRSIPANIREAVYSVGASRFRTSSVLLGYIRSALFASITIGVARMLGETASLLFTAFGSDYYTYSEPGFLLKPIGTLTLAIYNFAASPYENWVNLSWPAAFVLLLMTLSLFAASRALAGKR